MSFSERAYRKTSLLLHGVVGILVRRRYFEGVRAGFERPEGEQVFDGHLISRSIRNAADLFGKIHNLFVGRRVVDFILNRPRRLLCLAVRLAVKQCRRNQQPRNDVVVRGPEQNSCPHLFERAS